MSGDDDRPAPLLLAEFAMDLTPNGRSSVILLNGTDISGLLRGVVVKAHVNDPTSVELQPAHGKARAQLAIALPQARITIQADAGQLLAPWLGHLPDCGRLTGGDVCTCRLDETLAAIRP